MSSITAVSSVVGARRWFWRIGRLAIGGLLLVTRLQAQSTAETPIASEPAASSETPKATGSPRLAMAEALFREGRLLMDQQDFGAACPRLAESYEIDPRTGTLLALALCHERQGLIASAWAEYLIVAGRSRSENRDDRFQAATERAAELEPRLPRVTIELSEATRAASGLAVRMDDTEIGLASLGSPLPVDPGAHEIEATATGKQPIRHGFSIAESESKRLAVPNFVAVEAPQPPSEPPLARPAAPEPATPRDDDSLVTQRNIGIAAGGASLIGIGLGVVFDLQRRSANERGVAICPSGQNCSVQEAEDIRNLERDAAGARTREYVAFGAGAVLLAAGVVLFTTAPEAELMGMFAPFSVADGFGTPHGGGLQASLGW